MVYTLRFFSSKCSLFHNSNVFVSCIVHILLYTGCAKIKKKDGAKRWKRLEDVLVNNIYNFNFILLKGVTVIFKQSKASNYNVIWTLNIFIWQQLTKAQPRLKKQVLNTQTTSTRKCKCKTKHHLHKEVQVQDQASPAQGGASARPSITSTRKCKCKTKHHLHKEVQVQDQASPPQEIKNALFFSL